MRLRTVLIIAAALTACGAAFAADTPARSTVKFTRLARKLSPGTKWATLQSGTFCRTRATETSDGSLEPVKLDRYRPVFEREFGSGAARTSTNLFERPDEVAGADFEIGGLVREMDVTLCVRTPPFSNTLTTSGRAMMEVQWQLYSVAKREVVATISTTGSGHLDDSTDTDPVEAVLLRAFADNVRELADSGKLKAILDAPPATTAAAVAPGAGSTKLSFPVRPSAGRTPAEAVGAVVLVSLPDAFGSGVLVSSDGYILTNQHVVGASRTVRIRWSDGLETDGEVVRTHKGRDVALIKTDPRGREPLSIRTQPPQPGDPVLAIGAPLDKSLQGTVTRGVVSANRIIDGYAFLQSDVTVNHGNSGGALIDAQGYLVGLTDIGLAPNGDPVGLNFFIPIKDALDFLSMEPAAASAPVAPSASPPAKTRLSGPGGARPRSR